MGEGAQVFGSSAATSEAHYQGAGLEVESSGLEQALSDGFTA